MEEAVLERQSGAVVEGSTGYDPCVSVTGEGRPLVLVPGMDGTGELFYRQVPLLADSHRVVTYSLRDGTDSMRVLVEDLAGVIEGVAGGPEPVTVLGESFGGALSLSLALARPDLVGELVILNSFARFRPQLRLRLALWGLRLIPWGAMGLVRRLTAFRLHSSHTRREEVRRFLDLTAEASKEGYLNRLQILRSYDVRGDLDRIEARTLFLASEEDHLVPAVQQARRMAHRVPDATVRVLEGHGHVCLIAPDVDLAEILAEWRASR